MPLRRATAHQAPTTLSWRAARPCSRTATRPLRPARPAARPTRAATRSGRRDSPGLGPGVGRVEADPDEESGRGLDRPERRARLPRRRPAARTASCSQASQSGHQLPGVSSAPFSQSSSVGWRHVGVGPELVLLQHRRVHHPGDVPRARQHEAHLRPSSSPWRRGRPRPPGRCGPPWSRRGRPAP